MRCVNHDDAPARFCKKLRGKTISNGVIARAIQDAIAAITEKLGGYLGSYIRCVIQPPVE